MAYNEGKIIRRPFPPGTLRLRRKQSLQLAYCLGHLKLVYFKPSRPLHQIREARKKENLIA